MAGGGTERFAQDCAMFSAVDSCCRDLLRIAARALCGWLGRVACDAGRVAFPLGELTANCRRLRVRQLRPLETESRHSNWKLDSQLCAHCCRSICSCHSRLCSGSCRWAVPASWQPNCMSWVARQPSLVAASFVPNTVIEFQYLVAIKRPFGMGGHSSLEPQNT